jgi:Protein of unknown function (DUF1566)
MQIYNRLRFYLLSLGFVFLVSCSSSTPTEVAADFSINGVKGSISGQNVTIDLTATEACSTLNSLVMGVQANGASISPDPRVARDYSQPVQFTLTAPDGTKVVYIVTVKGNTCAPPPPVTPTVCKADAIGTTGYSLVFKECDANNVAQYYDKTECVRDNATGLIWEGKTTSGLRASGDKYNNLDSTVLLQIAAKSLFVPGQGVFNAPARPPTQAEIDSPLNSVWYKNSVNATTLCGASNWRMPTKDELLSIRVAGTTTLIDFEWFPNTEWYGSYATSTQFEDQQPYAWTVQFYNLGASSTSSTTRESSGVHPTLGPIYSPQNSIRLVRAP